MRDRNFVIFLLLLAVLYGVMALQITVPFAYDPLGPKPVPLTLAVIFVVLALIVLFRPGKMAPETQPLSRKALFLLAIMFFYQATWLLLGFLLSTTISVYLLSRLFRCSWMEGLMTALVVSVFCYGFFNFLLQVPLPLGTFFSYGSG